MWSEQRLTSVQWFPNLVLTFSLNPNRQLSECRSSPQVGVFLIASLLLPLRKCSACCEYYKQAYLYPLVLTEQIHWISSIHWAWERLTVSVWGSHVKTWQEPFVNHWIVSFEKRKDLQPQWEIMQKAEPLRNLQQLSSSAMIVSLV